MKEVILKRAIPKGTIVKDLYDDGQWFYKIGKTWYPVDFNGWKHPSFCEPVHVTDGTKCWCNPKVIHIKSSRKNI